MSTLPPKCAEAFCASEGQTIFNLGFFSYIPSTNNLEVYSCGQKLHRNIDYIETDSTTVTFINKCRCGDYIFFINVVKSFPDPTPEMLKTPEFDAIWQVIKTWDIKDDNLGYHGATGNNVRAILDALNSLRNEKACSVLDDVLNIVMNELDDGSIKNILFYKILALKNRYNNIVESNKDH